MTCSPMTYSRPPPSPELDRLLPALLGRALLPILPDESPAVRAPLLAIPCRVRARRGLRALVRTLRVCQLPRISMGAASSYAESGDVRGPRLKGPDRCRRVRVGPVHLVRVHRAAHVRYSWVRMLLHLSQCISSNKEMCRLDGHSVNARRLLSSWTLHFAAKATDGA